MKPNIANTVVRGEIYAPTELALLTQDMLEVELANAWLRDCIEQRTGDDCRVRLTLERVQVLGARDAEANDHR